MKKVVLLLVFVLTASAVMSQEKDREYRTILDGKDLRISGMGGPFMQFTMVDGYFAHFMGGGGGVLLNDFFFGGYGIGMTNRIPADRNAFEVNDDLTMSHGGFWIGYAIPGYLPIHASVSSLIGFGQLGTMSGSTYHMTNQDAIFVLTPILELEANVTNYLRIAAGATYNLVTGVNLQGYSGGNLSGPGAFLSFKFGWF